jgi:hypothetical protein
VQDCPKGDESQLVEKYNGSLNVTKEYVKLYSRATLQLQWKSEAEIKLQLPGYDPGNVYGQRWCTGTLIGEDRILTARHCFSIGTGYWVTPLRIAPDGRAMCAKPHLLARLLKANFGYTREGATPDVFPILELEEPRPDGTDDDVPCSAVKPDDGVKDYAIVKVGRNAMGQLPDTKYHPIAKVRVDDPRMGDPITVFQHPKSGPMKVAGGRLLDVIGSDLLYDTVDTFNTSSGSAIRDKDGMVIGVHTRGGCQNGYSTGGKVFYANAGIKASAILEISKILQDLTKR